MVSLHLYFTMYITFKHGLIIAIYLKHKFDDDNDNKNEKKQC